MRQLPLSLQRMSRDSKISCPLTATLPPRHVSRAQAKAVIRSYNIDLLKSQHIPGTRQWLYSDMDKWLQLGLEEHQSSSIDDAPDSDHASSTAVSPSTPAAPPSSLKHKMYMLLADPGMGKSIFSAMVEAKLSERSDQGVKVVSRLSWSMIIKWHKRHPLPTTHVAAPSLLQDRRGSISGPGHADEHRVPDGREAAGHGAGEWLQRKDPVSQPNRDVLSTRIRPSLSCSTMSWRSLAPTLGPRHCRTSLPGDEWI